MRKYNYQLKRSARRTLVLEITRQGTLLARAPHGVALEEIERFIAGHSEWIDSRLADRQAWLAAHPEPKPEEIARLRELARRELTAKTAAYAERMGVHPAAVTITSARTRFGSCSSQGRLCFSWRLMLYPETARDYIVVHELAHLKQLNHSAAFYAEIAAVLPDWQERRLLLK